MRGARILVVDDEPQIRRALRTSLDAHGYVVQTADDGEAALSALAASPADVVLLDLVMPGIDGFEVIRQTRQWSGVPIIVLSARGRDGDKVIALDLGADDYLTRPFSIDELLARVRAVLRRVAPGAEHVVTARDVVIDFERRTVRKGDIDVHLTPTEFALLRALASDPDRVVTHRQLLERLWGSHAASNAPQLRVYVNCLRRKLEADPADPAILVTEPGMGYRFRTTG